MFNEAAKRRVTSVLIPAYRRADQLLDCLDAIDAQTTEPLEVIVVARVDDDETRAALAGRSGANLRVVLVERPGQVHALNAGLAAARGEIIAITDDDAQPVPRWVELIEAHFADPTVGAVGGRVLVPRKTFADGSERLPVGTPGRLGRPYGNHHLADGAARNVYWLKGVNMAFRRQLCRFDSGLRGNGAQVANDSEASLRVHAAGWQVIFDPAAAVHHFAGPRFDEDGRDEKTDRAVRDAVYNETLVLLRWLSGYQRWSTFLFLLLVGVPVGAGPLGAMKAVVSGRRSPGDALHNCLHATRARLEALLQYLKERPYRDCAPSPVPEVTVVGHRVGDYGAMELNLQRQVTGLLDRGVRVTAVTRESKLAPHPNLEVVKVPGPSRPFPLASLSFFAAGTWTLARRRRGVVYALGAIVLNRVDARAVRFCHIAFRRSGERVSRASRDTALFRLNSAIAGYMNRSAERLLYRPRFTGTLVAQTRGDARELEAIFPDGLGQPRVIPNGIDTARFKPDRVARAELRRELGIDEDELVVVFAGGDWQRKGLFHVIDAVGQAPRWTLIAVGPGDVDAARRSAEGAGATKAFFPGRVADPERYMAAADALAMPSLYEPWGNSVLEAMAAGLPVITARANGPLEFVEDGVTGRFVDRDAAAIAAALHELEDDDLRLRRGAAALAAARGYSLDAVADAYVSLYRELAV